MLVLLLLLFERGTNCLLLFAAVVAIVLAVMKSLNCLGVHSKGDRSLQFSPHTWYMCSSIEVMDVYSGLLLDSVVHSRYVKIRVSASGNAN